MRERERRKERKYELRGLLSNSKNMINFKLAVLILKSKINVK
jgi:hypothetical protein